MRLLIALILAFAATALAADVSGTWKGSAETPMGTVNRTFVFHVDGKKLSGETTSNVFGKSTIEDGAIDGNNLSFTITATYQGNEMKAKYTGTVNGDEMKLHVDTGNGSVDYVVKRAQ